MKKRIVISLLVVGLLCCFSVVYASQEYSFDLQYTGSVLKNVEKDANVMLKGDNAPLYQKIRIKVDVEAKADKEGIFKTVKASAEQYVMQTGEEPFPSPIM